MVPYDIQELTIILSNNVFSPIRASCQEAKVTDEYRTVIKHNSNMIEKCPRERVYVTWKNQDLHSLDVQYFIKRI